MMKPAKRTKEKGTVLAAILAAAFLLAPGQGAAAAALSSGLFQLGGTVAAGADIIGESDRTGPDWADLFDAQCALRDVSPQNGIPDYADLYGGMWAVFLEDDVSLNVNLETSAVALEGEGVVNALAEADHDIGNAYAYATRDSAGNLVLFVGVERLGAGDSSLEFEFNQGLRRLGHGGFGWGAPWQIVGDRLPGDLLVLLDFVGGGMGSMEILSWDGAGFQPVEILMGTGCDAAGTACAAVNLLDIDGGPWPNRQPAADPEGIVAGRFYEIGLNVGVLLGSNPDYATICARSPQDIAFGYAQEGN